MSASAPLHGYGVIINDLLMNVSFDEEFYAEQWIKQHIMQHVTAKQFRDGVTIRVVRTIVTLAEEPA